jgi:hypothetical protein
MLNAENTAALDNPTKEQTPTGDVKYMKIENTTYEVVSNYIGKNSLMDIIKSAIKRDIERGNY